MIFIMLCNDLHHLFARVTIIYLPTRDKKNLIKSSLKRCPKNSSFID